MKRIGIIGGMSPGSTTHYYEEINRQVNEHIGGLSSADLVLWNVNFEEYHELLKEGDWQKISHRLGAIARDLVMKNLCDYVAMATNTMHRIADDIVGPYKWPRDYDSRLITVKIPLVHIGDCIAEKCKKEGVKRVALLGARFTMTADFMKRRLRNNGLEVVDIFERSEIDDIDGIIFDELYHGIVTAKSESRLLDIVVNADDRDMDNGGPGIDGFILGCTELELLCGGEPYSPVSPRHKHHYKFINSTQAHIDKLVELCLEDTE